MESQQSFSTNPCLFQHFLFFDIFYFLPRAINSIKWITCLNSEITLIELLALRILQAQTTFCKMCLSVNACGLWFRYCLIIYQYLFSRRIFFLYCFNIKIVFLFIFGHKSFNNFLDARSFLFTIEIYIQCLVLWFFLRNKNCWFKHVVMVNFIPTKTWFIFGFLCVLCPLIVLGLIDEQAYSPRHCWREIYVDKNTIWITNRWFINKTVQSRTLYTQVGFYMIYLWKHGKG